MDTVGFLMMAHMIAPEGLAEQAKLMESYGAQCVYVTDSAGALHARQYAERVHALPRCAEAGNRDRHPRPPQSQPGRRQLRRRRRSAGAVRVDASLAGMGAGAGNAPLEVFIAVRDALGWTHGSDCSR